jgi:hypothetical protein
MYSALKRTIHLSLCGIQKNDKALNKQEEKRNENPPHK